MKLARMGLDTGAEGATALSASVIMLSVPHWEVVRRREGKRHSVLGLAYRGNLVSSISAVVSNNIITRIVFIERDMVFIYIVTLILIFMGGGGL